jgi:hypothetical protein
MGKQYEKFRQEEEIFYTSVQYRSNFDARSSVPTQEVGKNEETGALKFGFAS